MTENTAVKDKNGNTEYLPKTWPGWMKYLPARLRINKRLAQFDKIEDLADAYLRIVSR